MKIFKVERADSIGWDEFDSFVVVAESEDRARCIHPNSCYVWNDGKWENPKYPSGRYDGWPSPDQLLVEYLGEACKEQKEGVVLASFNAG